MTATDPITKTQTFTELFHQGQVQRNYRTELPYELSPSQTVARLLAASPMNYKPVSSNALDRYATELVLDGSFQHGWSTFSRD